MKFFHQAGHNTKWNVESLVEDNVGDGVIFSPVNYDVVDMVGVEPGIKNRSIFDPQFYVPDSQKKNINTYKFFPEKVMNGYSTLDFNTQAHMSAELCVDFQLENDFEFIIIPARFFPDMITDFVERQKVFTVEPFLNAVKKTGTSKKVFVTLPLTISMIIDQGYRDSLLNWITSYPEIDGVYLLVNFNEPHKQIQNFEKLSSYITFINDIKYADLEVICGCCNTEGLLLTLLDVDIITMGAFENTRKFSIDKFLELEVTKRGPVSRVYLPGLLNWVRYNTVVEIKEGHPDLWSLVYSGTEYMERVFERESDPHFTQSETYMHHLILIDKQYRELNALPQEERFGLLKEKIDRALDIYNEIDERSIMLFNRSCSGDHLLVWKKVIESLEG
ncbi:MAG: hypothetical protein GY754_30320 [bacterium]|nr:hypothetical protein [bacterium]